ncbi:hypothetical protein [Paenibacillus sp. P22]|uniref:hypothetical protein n=1 Tax=Paenibacillus TaxID=44249 RepID=UPI000390391D|nr:hypothetical protein [Paenibacillus sp. P22]CDN41349.1 hypothetical protein BN871_AF_00050 [Paenibacillus sp. P22]
MSQGDAIGQLSGGPIAGWIGSRYAIRASLAASVVLPMPVLALYARIRRIP